MPAHDIDGCASVEQLLTLARRRRVLMDAWNAPGPDIDDRAREILSNQADDIAIAIADTAAEDLAALHVKARFVEELIAEVTYMLADAERAVIESLLEDIERLAAGGGRR